MKFKLLYCRGRRVVKEVLQHIHEHSLPSIGKSGAITQKNDMPFQAQFFSPSLNEATTTKSNTFKTDAVTSDDVISITKTYLIAILRSN